jgi:hypothetical protein
LQDPEAYGSVSILPTFRDAIIFDPWPWKTIGFFLSS